MKNITKYIFILVLLILTSTSVIFSDDNIKLIPSGDVVFIKTKCEYPYISKRLDKKQKDLKIGDIIVKINDDDLKNISNDKIVKNYINKENENLKITLLRKNKEININMTSDELRQYELDNLIEGIGTITVFNQKGEFFALSHNIHLNKTDLKIKKCDICTVDNVREKKSKKNRIGYLIADNKNIKIAESNEKGEYGIKGNLIETEFLNNEALEISQPREGKAWILCITPVTNTKKLHEINITKVGKDISNIEVIDKDLIKYRGGLVQGMSGSPIIQDNKVVGGLRSIYITNPKKGKISNIHSIINQ